MKRCLLVGVLLVVGVIAVLPSGRPLAAGAGAGLPANVPKVTVVRSGVLGGYAEDITYVSGGRYKGFVAMKIGQEVLGAKLTGNSPQPVKLFDLTAAGYLPFRPTGLVYWPDRDRFVVNNHAGVLPGWTEYMYVFDSFGRLERWPVVRDEPLRPTYSEGLAYIPGDWAAWPAAWRGRFVLVVPNGGSVTNPRLEVLQASNGTFRVEQQIPLPMIASWGGVAALPSGDLLLARYGDCNISRWNPADPDLFSPEPVIPCNLSGEGIAVLPDSSVVVSTDPPDLRLVTFPPTPPGGTWNAIATRDLHVGLGIPFPTGLAWDSIRQQFLVRYTTTVNYWPYSNALAAFPLSLSEWMQVRVLSEFPAEGLDRNFTGMTYDGVSDAAVVARVGRAVEDFGPDAPSLWQQTRTPALLDVPLASPELPATTVELAGVLKGLAQSVPTLYNPNSWNNGPGAVAFLSDEGRYAVRFNGGGNRIYVLEPDLTVNREIHLSVACSDPTMTFGYNQFAASPVLVAGARFVALGSCSKGSGPADVGPRMLAFLDANGIGLFQVEVLRELGMMSASHVTFVTSGPHAGAVAVLGGPEFPRFVVFRVK
jgi:hypothetical protein